MKLDEAIKILTKWEGGGFATRIEDMSPAVKLSIEALKRCQRLRSDKHCSPIKLLPGETD